jgi:phospholipase C
MSTTRREFLRHAAYLAGLGAVGGVPESIRRAMAIAPDAGTTFLDAEHVVILMQENRSFDHTFGTLRGVRGLNDPRAITLPDGCPVWAQRNAKGERFLPFRLNINDTKSTWMGSLPHSWTDQVDARNNGRYDRWLDVKHSGDDDFAAMPLTMGYYTRQDIPFYYALADAFTVCDQNFCSSLTGTTPNRLHLWSGTVRARQDASAPANILNSDVDYGRWADWTTFPERLQDLGVSWKVYQNELSIESGLDGEKDAWLANFTDNPLEWFSQFGVRFSKKHRVFVERRIGEIPGEIAQRKGKLAAASGKALEKLEREIRDLEAKLTRYEKERTQFSAEKFAALSDREKQLHQRAFCDNADDPDYRELTRLTYRDGDIERSVEVPKGDPLHQFRKDVAEGTLPTVSWLVPSERFSDHPGSAWYGAWYLSETLDILTKNPEVWKKTIFILTYDENDGYFDHVPPFVAPDPSKPETGGVSEGIDASLEFVTLEQDKVLHARNPRESAIGLGYRVPMVIASPWTRGGNVCSQVFDHTSVLQLLENVLSHKTGKPVRETNINAWRRAVCGDLTSVFAAAADSASELTPLDRDAVVMNIHKAQFKGLPDGYHALDERQVAQVRRGDLLGLMAKQEAGTRRACPLPYELFVSDSVNIAAGTITLRFEARKDLFGPRASGAAFTVYAVKTDGDFSCRTYAAAPGTHVEGTWNIADFPSGLYCLIVHGPNGFCREFRGTSAGPAPVLRMLAPKLGTAPAAAEVRVEISAGSEPLELTIHDHGYALGNATHHIAPGSSTVLKSATDFSGGWYDFTVECPALPGFSRRFAGKLECGVWTTSDPAMA